MREIKFRAWDGKTMRHSLDGFHSEMDVCEDVWDWFVNMGFTVMQFTGLKDKNGKGNEVYESDLFKIIYENAFGEMTETIGEVVFKFGRWMIKHIHPLTNDTAFAPLYEFLKNSTQNKILGNVHENPELITP